MMMKILVQTNYSVKSTRGIFHKLLAADRATPSADNAATILSALQRAGWLWKILSAYLQSDDLEALITKHSSGELEHSSFVSFLCANLFNSYGVGGPQDSMRC
jgi:hypothetical protein